MAADVLRPELLSDRGYGSGRPEVDPVDQADRMTGALVARLRDNAEALVRYETSRTDPD